MPVTDPIADYLTRIRNALQVGKKYVDIPASNLKKHISQILLDEHYISNYIVIDDGVQGSIRIYLKYDRDTSVITGLKRISKPGLRRYAKAANLPRVLNNLGIAVLSTPVGVISNKEAKLKNVGGEVLFYVW